MVEKSVAAMRANRHPGTDPRLQPALAYAIAALAPSTSRWRRPVQRVLATRRFELKALKYMAGYNPAGPFLPVIHIDEQFFHIATPDVLTRLLVHESLHQCFVVWPEWKLWINWAALRLRPRAEWRDRYYPVIPHERIYGIGVNSADTITAELLAGRPIS